MRNPALYFKRGVISHDGIFFILIDTGRCASITIEI